MKSAEAFRKEIENLKPEHDKKRVEEVAKRLDDFNFSPTLIFPVDNFKYMQRKDWLKEFDRIWKMPASSIRKTNIPDDSDPEEYRIKQLSLINYWSKLVYRLRNGEPEAWDEINELYEDD